MVLLKHADDNGFAFYTNYRSSKAKELEGIPWQRLCLLAATERRYASREQ